MSLTMWLPDVPNPPVLPNGPAATLSWLTVILLPVPGRSGVGSLELLSCHGHEGLINGRGGAGPEVVS